MERLNYIPERGDLVGFNLNPTRGHEQKGYRPSIVITNKKFNRIHNRMVTCPITSTVRNHPLEVEINTPKVKGVILPDQIRSVDWTVRKLKFLGQASSETLQDVCYKLELLIKEQ
ncbi:MAG: type II toxin-antitoxin system PemK/MazF family toxin [Candidatus Zambryskibacteria bacterium]|nr:type II toxin-antitoxin system PemK/MazF family toxin [Candidatus Zambryskibacteria bacterium]